MTRTRIISILVAAFVLIAVPARAQGVDQERLRLLESAFVMNFMKFTEWPREVMPPADQPLVLTVIGSGEMAEALGRTLSDRKVQGRTVEVHSIEWPSGRPAQDGDPGRAELALREQLGASHAVLMVQDDMRWVAAVARYLRESATLTISDQFDAIGAGVHLAMGVEDGRVVFEAGRSAIDASPLSISSQLLKLARVRD